VTKDIFYAITTTTTTIILLFIISGEHAFLECSTPVLVANQIVNAGASKSCMLSSKLKDSDFLVNLLPVG